MDFAQLSGLWWCFKTIEEHPLPPPALWLEIHKSLIIIFCSYAKLLAKLFRFWGCNPVFLCAGGTWMHVCACMQMFPNAGCASSDFFPLRFCLFRWTPALLQVFLCLQRVRQFPDCSRQPGNTGCCGVSLCVGWRSGRRRRAGTSGFKRSPAAAVPPALAVQTVRWQVGREWQGWESVTVWGESRDLAVEPVHCCGHISCMSNRPVS